MNIMNKYGLDIRWIIIVKNIISLDTMLVALTVGEAVGELEDSGSNVGLPVAAWTSF